MIDLPQGNLYKREWKLRQVTSILFIPLTSSNHHGSEGFKHIPHLPRATPSAFLAFVFHTQPPCISHEPLTTPCIAFTLYLSPKLPCARHRNYARGVPLSPTTPSFFAAAKVRWRHCGSRMFHKQKSSSRFFTPSSLSLRYSATPLQFSPRLFRPLKYSYIYI